MDEEELHMADEVETKNGRASAALIAGGIGAVAMGLLTILAESIHALSKALNWYNPTGDLSGKSTRHSAFKPRNRRMA